jgi:hypothetical protein
MSGLVASTVGLVACGGDAFQTGSDDGDQGNGGDAPGPGDGPSPTGGADDVEPRLDVAPATALAELAAAERTTLCADLLRVFNTEVDNDAYRELHCTEFAYRDTGGEDPECSDRFDACLEQLPRPTLADRVADSFGCDATRQGFQTPAGPVELDNACATVGQSFACWRAFGVAYERGFLDAVMGSPTSCAEARADAPDLSAQVGFGIPGACDDLVSAASGCP